MIIISATLGMRRLFFLTTHEPLAKVFLKIKW